MRTLLRPAVIFLNLALFSALFCTPPAPAQSGASSGTISGTVTDPTGAVIPGASVTIRNPVSQYRRTVKTNAAGDFKFPNVPFARYQLTAVMTGFSTWSRVVPVEAAAPVTVSVKMKLGAAATTIHVTSQSLVSDAASMDTEIDRQSFRDIPLESQSSGLSSLITLTAPGVTADSNGMIHGLGDHAENGFSIDGQPVTDQVSKTFSNELPNSAVQSMKVIEGAPPAQYGDKTSLVIQITTRSGQGDTKPVGDAHISYGSFGTVQGGFDLGYGGRNWGNFFTGTALNTGRFLDSPEFAILHDKGNEENLFDRIDYTLDPKNSLHLNMGYSHSWFQTPNTYDNLNLGGVNIAGHPVPGQTDQRSKIDSFNFAPSYTRIVTPHLVWNVIGYVRRDGSTYYPSPNPFEDLGPVQQETLGQYRTLTNTGLHTDISWVHGINNVKAGLEYYSTFLNENDSLGIVDPTYLNSLGCMAGNVPTGPPCTYLLPYDLTRGGGLYDFHGHADIREFSQYVEDIINKGNWLFNLGIRGDVYDGLTKATQAEPRLGGSYTIKKTHTVLRASYARTLETPYNENLVLSSNGCLSPVLGPLLQCTAPHSSPLSPGYRNEYHLGLQQVLARHVVFTGEYIWKYTQNAYDFSVLGNTPISFPIEWKQSKIPGFAARVTLTPIHNFSAYFTAASVAARFFPPQVGGAGATVGQTGLPFRIDHDERLNSTTHLQYKLPGKWAPFFSFNWRYDSGMVAGAVPCFNPLSHDPNTACAATSIFIHGQPGVSLTSLDADEEFEAGMACNGVKATLGHPLPSACLASQFTSTLVKIPAPYTGDNDKNPPRVDPRSLFDMSLAEDNLFHEGRYRIAANITAINITDKYTMYNFLSTFSGTHYVTPRSITGQVSLHF